MLAKARQILVGELALAENTDDARAMTMLDEVLATAS
jgi:CarD family transcriptional regulator